MKKKRCNNVLQDIWHAADVFTDLSPVHACMYDSTLIGLSLAKNKILWSTSIIIPQVKYTLCSPLCCKNMDWFHMEKFKDLMDHSGIFVCFNQIYVKSHNLALLRSIFQSMLLCFQFVAFQPSRQPLAFIHFCMGWKWGLSGIYHSEPNVS